MEAAVVTYVTFEWLFSIMAWVKMCFNFILASWTVITNFTFVRFFFFIIFWYVCIYLRFTKIIVYFSLYVKLFAQGNLLKGFDNTTIRRYSQVPILRTVLISCGPYCSFSSMYSYYMYCSKKMWIVLLILITSDARTGGVREATGPPDIWQIS